MTIGSATCLGIQQRTGCIRQGYEADLIIFDQNPLLSIDALNNIRFIVNDGKVVLHQLDQN